MKYIYLGLILLNLFFTEPVMSKTNLDSDTQNSAMESGNWYKIKIDQTGVYKLTYDELLEIGLTNPENVQLYGYGGNQLSFYNSDFSGDDMVQNPIVMEKGSDDIFNEGDYILFYTKGPLSWTYNEDDDFFEHHIHQYSNYIYLFLTDSFSDGQKIESDNSNYTSNYSSDEMDDLKVYHNETYNLITSGRFWYTDKLSPGSSVDCSFTFPNLIENSSVNVQMLSAGHKIANTNNLVLTVSENSTALATVTTSSAYSTYVYAIPQSTTFNFIPSSNSFTLNCKYSGSSSAAEGYIGYLELNARSNLTYQNEQLLFRDKNSVGDGTITTFNLNNNGTEISVWDVTSDVSPIKMNCTTNGNSTKFTIPTDSLKEFIAFDDATLLSPITKGDGLGLVSNQNLHGIESCNMVIVTLPDYMSQAEELAELRRAEPYNLNVNVVTPEQIYNEFSSGTPDASAIRNFVRYLYNNQKNSDEPLKYLLLFGDGSYDNKGITNDNLVTIPTFESENSTSEGSSFVTDDFYGLLEEGEGEYIGSLEIGIGRFPVSTVDQAQLIIDKIKNYESEQSLGNWRSRICFIADDEDSGTYVSNAEVLANKTILSNQPQYNIEKIYFDAYTQEETPAGQRYPDVTDAINNVVKKGALIINYIGHGNPSKLGHEDVLLTSDVQKWKNYNKLAVFVTASCEVGRFDDHEVTSLGEWILLNANGGGVAAFTTTRVVSSGGNQALDSNFLKNAFDPDLCLGDMIRIAKNKTASKSDTNKRNFTLLGDPSMKLAVPVKKVLLTQINDTPVSSLTSEETSIESNSLLKSTDTSNDTISALSTVKISGYLVDENEDLIDQDGVLYLSVYDKAQTIYTKGNDSDSPVLTFEIQNSVLYKGKASVSNGFFETEFILPKDIDYSVGNGKISLYATLEDSSDANGYSEDLIIGGTSESSLSDTEGPTIELFMNDTTFVNGGITDENPVLLAKLSDNYGINTSGNGIGHNITAILDSNYSSALILNDFYEGELDQYNCGEVQYPYSELEPGYHTITFKAWDINNNSSSAEIGFYVYGSTDVVIDDLRNAPNPFSDGTYFMFNHNQSETEFVATIRIYNTLGALMQIIETNAYNGTYSVDPIYWDGTSAGGQKLEDGIYIYKMEIKTSDGQKSSKSSKLMIFK